MANEDLANIYERHIRSEDFAERERALEDCEESYYFDGAITYEQYTTLIRLYAEVSGDFDILRNS